MIFHTVSYIITWLSKRRVVRVGLRSTIGNRVTVISRSRVRISCSPPKVSSAFMVPLTFFVCKTTGDSNSNPARRFAAGGGARIKIGCCEATRKRSFLESLALRQKRLTIFVGSLSYIEKDGFLWYTFGKIIYILRRNRIIGCVVFSRCDV